MKTIKALTTAITIASATSLGLITSAQAHCEVPCGIYSDDTVFTDLHTHQATIEKAMTQIKELSKDPGKNANQLIRWVNNKELHATKIQETVAQYFIAQRIKIDEKDKNKYLLKLTQLHQISVYAMKCKQTTDLENAQKLHQLIDDFKKTYQSK